jgi:hypothetical protein
LVYLIRSASQLEVQFSDSREKMSLSGFKRRMMDMGFMLTDFPDDDLVVLDDDNDGTFSPLVGVGATELHKIPIFSCLFIMIPYQIWSFHLEHIR